MKPLRAPRSRGGETRRRRGFTLIEVLAAFTIAAIMLLALMQAMTRGLSGIEAAERRSRLLAAAENVLADVGGPIPLERGRYSGETGELAWRVRIAPAEQPAGVRQNAQRLGISLLTVEVTVESGEDTRQRLQTMRLARPGR